MALKADAQLWHIRNLNTAGEAAIAQRESTWPHSQPHSTYVASIGANYDPGVWEKIVNMVLYTQQRGLKCWLDEIVPARGGVLPTVDIGYMRDVAVRRALDSGFEYICFVDGDTLPEMDILAKMLEREVPISGPYMTDPDFNNIMLGAPLMEPGSGLQPAQWLAASFMLFRTSVFNCPGVGFNDGAGDELFFRNLWHYGHRPYIHTDVELKLVRGPTRGGAMTWKDRWKRLENLYAKSKQIPDRMPVNPKNEHIVDGIYAPFMKGSQNGH
jgi:hypothetical protein